MRLDQTPWRAQQLEAQGRYLWLDMRAAQAPPAYHPLQQAEQVPPPHRYEGVRSYLWVPGPLSTRFVDQPHDVAPTQPEQVARYMPEPRQPQVAERRDRFGVWTPWQKESFGPSTGQQILPYKPVGSYVIPPTPIPTMAARAFLVPGPEWGSVAGEQEPAVVNVGTRLRRL